MNQLIMGNRRFADLILEKKTKLIVGMRFSCIYNDLELIKAFEKMKYKLAELVL